MHRSLVGLNATKTGYPVSRDDKADCQIHCKSGLSVVLLVGLSVVLLVSLSCDLRSVCQPDRTTD